MWQAPGRAHIEVRAADRLGRERMNRDLEEALRAVDGVRSAQVNAVLGRVVVAFEVGRVEVDDLIEVIEEVEEAHDVAGWTFPPDRPEHPADFEPVRREAVAFAADVLGLSASVFGQVLRFTPIPIELASVVSLVESEPRVRGFFEQHLGAAATDLGLGLSNAVAQALSQGPLGLAVDATHRANLFRESQERRGSWARREQELCAERDEEAAAAMAHTDRPARLPSGPIERYADRATLVSLGVAGAALPITRSPRRAASFVVAGLPKAGRMGRDAFAASLGRHLARRDVIVFDRAALRKLDRVSCALLDSDILVQGNVLGQMVPVGSSGPTGDRRETPHPGDVLGSVAHKLFDDSDPAALRSRGSWELGPLEAIRKTGAWMPPDCARKATSLRRKCTTVLAIAHGGKVVGLVAVDAELDPLAETVVDTARRGGLSVAVAGEECLATRVATLLGVDALPGKDELRATVEALQREGHGVLLVSGDGPALRAADCGVGVTACRRGQGVPWGADLLVKSGLVDIHLVTEAVATARGVSTHCAVFAAAGSGIGAER
jgi:cation-transporting P-type ATPase I